MSYNYEEMNWSDVRDIFRKWREDNERKSDEIIHLWDAILEDKIHKVGNERPIILEQVILAALDTGRMEIAEKCIRSLSAEFPGSMRVQKFKAMRLEALEHYDEALDILDGIIKTDETNAGPRKRKVVILKAKGRIIDAIKELNEYLKIYMSDQEAWNELCNLYLMEGDYSKAAFCMEEVLLHNPHNHLIYQRLAEIRYTLGGVDNIEIAKTYYSQAIKLNPNNLRALYGLYLCCNYISKAVVSKRKEAQKLAQWALTEATEITAKTSTISNNDKYVTAVENAFGNLELKSN